MQRELLFEEMEKINIPRTDKPRVVIVGGGFGGVQLVQNLRNKGYQVVLFDRHNYHTFQPLLYQVATAGLEPDSVAEPLRKIFSGKPDFHFRIGSVQQVFPAEKRIETTVGELEYDYLVLANGSKVNFFGNEQIYLHGLPLKQLHHALELRSKILQAMERAEQVTDPVALDKLLTFVVVGGGPTGVEVAGSLSELRSHVLPKDYPHLDLSRMRIVLVEGLDRVLSSMSEKASQNALKDLHKLGIDVRLNTLVESYNGKIAKLNDGTEIWADTLIWAAGVEGNILEGIGEEMLIKGNRIRVDEYNRVVGYDDIFAIGDVAAMVSDKNPNGHPALAPVAMQQGRQLARNLVNLMSRRPLEPFKYFDKGSMATIGRNKAVADLPGGASIRGILAWLAWMLIHLLFLVGFRNKAITLANWIYNYFTYDRGIRLIVRPPAPLDVKKESVEQYT